MFDSTKTFTIETIDGKTCKLRWPSDKQWAARACKGKLIKRDIGRGKSKWEPQPDRQFDLQLLNSVRIDKDGDPFDEYDAAFVLGRLNQESLVSIERTGAGVNQRYTVEMGVPGGSVTHVLRGISQKQYDQYNAAANTAVDGTRMTEFRAQLDPAEALFNEQVVESVGYGHNVKDDAGAVTSVESVPVPIIHKAAVIRFIVDDIGTRIQDTDPEV